MFTDLAPRGTDKRDFSSLRGIARIISREVATTRGGFFPGHQILVAADLIRALTDDGYQVGGPNGDFSLAAIWAAVKSTDRGCDPLALRQPNGNVKRLSPLYVPQTDLALNGPLRYRVARTHAAL
jgi:hypothetical protein